MTVWPELVSSSRAEAGNGAASPYLRRNNPAVLVGAARFVISKRAAFFAKAGRFGGMSFYALGHALQIHIKA